MKIFTNKMVETQTLKKFKISSFIFSILFFFWGFINDLNWMFIIGAVLLYLGVLFTYLQHKKEDEEELHKLEK